MVFRNLINGCRDVQWTHYAHGLLLKSLAMAVPVAAIYMCKTLSIKFVAGNDGQ